MRQLIFLFLCIPLMSCSPTDKGAETAELFWKAVESEDFGTAAAYTLESDPLFIRTTLLVYRNYKAQLGTPRQLDDRIIIPTILENPTNGKSVKLYTIVTTFNDQYRIDYKKMVDVFVIGLKDKLDQHISQGKDWLDQQLDTIEQLLEPLLEDQPVPPDDQYSI